ncbi:uncharacterized protein BDV17DRAFT_159640 [Aspergillus undulatus]|uniref:uncharacterized protein n=1 Tax=Aspergillus undulatus TaxID=1810928 RepID=UPI003CCD1A31
MQLSQHFVKALVDISNFHMQPQFLAEHPDLTVYTRADSHSSIHATLPTGRNPIFSILQNPCSPVDPNFPTGARRLIKALPAEDSRSIKRFVLFTLPYSFS